MICSQHVNIFLLTLKKKKILNFHRDYSINIQSCNFFKKKPSKKLVSIVDERRMKFRRKNKNHVLFLHLIDKKKVENK